MLCNFCGGENADGSRVCAHCGKPLTAPAAERAETRCFTVDIVRTNQTFLINPPMNVSVDGAENQSIANGETLSLRLPAGRHTILFTRGLLRRELTFDLAGNCAVRLQWNRLTGGIEAKIR